MALIFLQLLAILLLGFLSFAALFFFCALYLQELFGYSALITAVCLLPTAVSGVIVNVSSSAAEQNTAIMLTVCSSSLPGDYCIGFLIGC